MRRTLGASGRREERAQLVRGLLRRLLREIVPAWQRLAGSYVGGVARPDLHGFVIAADAAGRAPQQQHRAGYLAPGGEVRGIHVEIDAMGGAIVLAHGVDGGRIAEIALVLGERRRIEEAQPLLGLRQLPLDEIIVVGAHQSLGKIIGLDHEEPVPGEGAPLARHVVEQMMLRDDVEDGRARDLLRMIEAHAVEHAGAAIMAGGVEALETERRHHLDLVLRHGAERIAAVILAARRLFRIPVAAQVGGDHGEFARQPRRDFVPGQVREWIAVQQQQRGSVAAAHRDDARAAGLDFAAGEAFEHPRHIQLRAHRRGGHFAAMPAALASVTAIGASRAMRASNSSGCMTISSTPSLESFSFTDGSRSPFTVSAWMRATMSRGVFFGTTMPTQKSKSESGTPASSVVGTSGRADVRFELLTASAKTLPSRMNGIATVSGQK